MYIKKPIQFELRPDPNIFHIPGFVEVSPPPIRYVVIWSLFGGSRDVEVFSSDSFIAARDYARQCEMNSDVYSTYTVKTKKV